MGVKRYKETAVYKSKTENELVIKEENWKTKDDVTRLNARRKSWPS